jgi:hypothetical protein
MVRRREIEILGNKPMHNLHVVRWQKVAVDLPNLGSSIANVPQRPPRLNQGYILTHCDRSRGIVLGVRANARQMRVGF